MVLASPFRSLVQEISENDIGEAKKLSRLEEYTLNEFLLFKHFYSINTVGVHYIMTLKFNKRKNHLPSELKHVNLDAAGIDIGATSHFVAVPEGRDKESVREFKSFTKNLHELVVWLKKCKIKTVAMESTGVYWISLYELLEAEGFEVHLVNAKHVKNVPGRKSDVLDCQWLQQLHTYGLLRGSFRPEESICVLRAYMRQRDRLIKSAATHIQHMQKAMTQMNIQLHHVISDVSGVTGLKIIRAIVAGERDVSRLASLRERGCKNSIDVIEKALEGNYRQEHVFTLTQALELYDTYQAKMVACDEEIEKIISELAEKKGCKGTDSLPLTGKQKRRKNQMHFDLGKYLFQMTGVDLTRIDGLDSYSVLRLISEVGMDMSVWPTAKHFGSWLGLAPGTKISGGKKLSTRTKSCKNRASTLFRIVANALTFSHSATGAFLRRKKSHLGAPKAITATAYKIARQFYAVLKNGNDYVDAGSDYYEEQYKGRVIRNLAYKAEKFGFILVEKQQTAS